MTEPHPHPDSLFDSPTLALAYADLLAVLAKDHPGVLARAARALENGAADLRALTPASTLASPGAFLARAWIARVHPECAEGLDEGRARAAADRFLNGALAQLMERTKDGLVFAYDPAEHVPGVAAPRVRVRPVERGRRVAVELLDPTGAIHVATPPLTAWPWDERLRPAHDPDTCPGADCAGCSAEWDAAQSAAVVTEAEARETAGEVLMGEGRVLDLLDRLGAGFVFRFDPFTGAAARGPDARVLVTPLDGDHVRVQLGGTTVCARARVRR